LGAAGGVRLLAERYHAVIFIARAALDPVRRWLETFQAPVTGAPARLPLDDVTWRALVSFRHRHSAVVDEAPPTRGTRSTTGPDAAAISSGDSSDALAAQSATSERLPEMRVAARKRGSA
jgi:hypothetical protein